MNASTSGLERQLIGPAEIARLAGVRTRSAVSNWRRRYADFPAVAGRGPNGDLFRLDEVRDWLDRTGRLRSGSEPEPLQRIAGLRPLEAALDAATATIALLSVAPQLEERLHGRRRPDTIGREIARTAAATEQANPQLSGVFATLHRQAPADQGEQAGADLLGQVWKLLHQALEQSYRRPAGGPDLPAAFEDLLQWRALVRGRHLAESRSAGWVAELVVALAGADEGVVFDPAAGEGGFLLAAAEAGARRPPARPAKERRLLGHELDEEAWQVARQRLLVHGLQAEVERVDSLSAASPAAGEVNAVVCDPPYGLQRSAEDWSPTDTRWRFGIPAPSADLAWLELAIDCLRPGGRGCVLLPATSTFRTGVDARIRLALLGAGAIEAVIALPPIATLYTSVPVVAWLVCAQAEGEAGEVLFVDASEWTPAPQRATARGGEAEPEIARQLESIVRAWREDPDRFSPQPRVAVSVEVAELLEAQGNLLPARWTQRSVRRPQSTISAIERAGQALDDARAALASRPPVALRLRRGTATPPPRRRLRELRAAGRIEFIAGIRMTPDPGAGGDTPALGPWTFRGDPPRSVTTTEQTPLTRAGDLIVMQSPGGVEATVDTEGGHALLAPLRAIRVCDESLRPAILAAFLSDPENIRLSTGGTGARVRLDDIEIPELAPETQDPLEQTIADLDELVHLHRRAALQAARLRSQLIAAIGSGAVGLAEVRRTRQGSS